MSRRSASDALKSTQVKTDEPKAEEPTPVTPEVDAKGSEVDGKVDSPEAAAQDVTPATAGDFAPEDEAETDGDDWDATVSVIVIHDAFNYFEDGVHLTAKKGDRVELEADQLDRAVSLKAVRQADQD
jgi:hypothetical protein